MMKRILKKCTGILLILLILLSAASCSRARVRFGVSEKIVFTCDDVLLNEAETRLIAAHYASIFNLYYRDLLGEGFWSEKVSDAMTYEDYVKQYYVQDECKLVLALNAMAENRKFRLSSEEKEKLEQAAAQTYSQMSEAVKEYTGAEEKDVRSLITKYYAAEAMIGSMLENEKIGISEEESRVADIQVIRMKDRLGAEEVYGRIKRNENFLTLAREFSIDETVEYSVSKSDLNEPFHSVVFSMSEGDVSEMIEQDGYYYIIRLSNTYNTLLSMKNSANLLAQQKFEKWSDTLDVFMKEHAVGVVRQNFDEISLASFTETKTFDLFRQLN